MVRLLTLPLTLLAWPLHAQEASALLKYIPPQANTVAVINTASILSSNRAIKEGWAKLDHTEYLAGAVPLNPMVERMVIAKQLNPLALGEGGTLALIPVAKSVVLADLAKRIEGQETTIAGEPAVVSPTGVDYFKFDDKLLGSIRTDNKQEVGRWLKFVKTAKDSQLHKVLNAAVALSPRHHITIAVDTEDIFHEHEIDVAVAVSKSLQGDAEQSKMIGKFLKSLHGIIFTAEIASAGIEAKIRFDSAAYDFKIKPEAFKAFIIETLARNGAMLQDMQTAKMTAGDNSLTFTFMVSDTELSRVMSLVLPPAAIPNHAESIAIAPGTPTAAMTVKYFNAVNLILDDVKAQTKKATDYTQTALWHQTAAGKIEMLSTIGVDKSVIEYGYGTASRLQAIAASLSGVPAKVDDLQGEVYAMGYMPRRGLWSPRGGGRINPFTYGNSQIQTNAGDIANKQAKVIKDDAKNRDTIWGVIDGKRSENRSMIVEKYNVMPLEKK